MLTDAHNRRIDYLRISVTDRCNLGCIYCMPELSPAQKPPAEILTFEEIARIARTAIAAGINKIKITGGEPLVRKDLPRLVRLLAVLPGLKDLSLTTNGVLLARYAKELKEAGLKKINVSLDTLIRRRFREVTRSERFADVLRGIDAGIAAGFFLKLNVVLMRGINDDEVLDFAAFAKECGVVVRFIELMPTVVDGRVSADLYISCDEVKDRLNLLGGLKPLAAGSFGNGPARYYEIADGKGPAGPPGGSAQAANTSYKNLADNALVVGFISAVSDKFCSYCNRLRLTADGLLLPCLDSPAGYDLKTPLRAGNEERVESLIRQAVFTKPRGHDFTFSSPRHCLMSQIGG